MNKLEEVLRDIMEHISQHQEEKAFQILNQNIKLIQEFLLLILENGIISQKDAEKISIHLVEAMENKDAVLLDDVIRYALYSIYRQLFEEE